jgi:hypothetical protein
MRRVDVQEHEGTPEWIGAAYDKNVVGSAPERRGRQRARMRRLQVIKSIKSFVCADPS